MGLRDIFRPRTEHSDPGVRARSAASLDDKGQLFAMAAFDEDADVARAAIERLAQLAREDGDLKHLEALASSDLHRDRAAHAAGLLRSWRLDAVAGVGDLPTLAAIAATHEDEAVRQAALARIPDEPMLAEVIRQADRDPGNALDRVQDQKLLRDLAFHARLGAVRRQAIGRMADMAVLLEIARDPKQDAWARETAIDRIGDPAALAHLVLEGSPGAKRALARLEDSTWLGRVALEAPNLNDRMAAIGRTSDVDALFRIAVDDPGTWERGLLPGEAIRRLRDLGSKAVLEAVARSAAAPERRVEAIGCLDEPTLLFELATGDANPKVREAAAGRIKDPEMLRRLADSPRLEGATARARLESSAVLVAEALRGPSPEIRLAAIARLRDLDPLDEIAETEREQTLREAAATRRSAVKAWQEAQAELRLQIASLTARPDYQLELEIKTSEDSESFVAPTYDQVERLKAQLRALIEAGRS